MKRHRSAFLACVVTVLFLLGATISVSANGQGEKTGSSTTNQGTIVFIPKSTSAAYYLSLLQGAKDRGKQLGYKIDYEGPSTEAMLSSQVNLVENVAARKPAGILLAALDSKALIAPVTAAIKEGVPVVMVDSGIASQVPDGSIVTDQYKGGYMAGIEMAKELGGKGLVANLGIEAGSISSKRSTGFDAAIAKYPGMRVLPTQWTDAIAAKSLNIMANIITGNPNLKGVFSAAAPIAVGAAQALKAQGLAGKVKLVTFDPTPGDLPLFKNGTVSAIIAQDPYKMGYDGVTMIDEARHNKTIANKDLQLPPVLVVPSNFKQPSVQKIVMSQISTE